MSLVKQERVAEQFDMFLPYLADLPLRDQREMMERPFFSLAKRKRVKPIDYTSPDGKLWVHVSANPDYGMATIWDADILIYCASQLADLARRGANDVPRKINIMPYDLLRAIGRPTTGRSYELLGQALDRLVATTIKTNIRSENRKEATFSWLDGWTQLIDEKTERPRGMTLELSNWFWEGVLMKGGILSIDRAYFAIPGGRERWLYRVSRKHAGGAGEDGFAISLPVLFEKSGAEGQYRRFKFELLKLAEKNTLPGYSLSIEKSSRDGEPLLRMRRADGKDGAETMLKHERPTRVEVARKGAPRLSSPAPTTQLSKADDKPSKDADTSKLKVDAASLVRSAVADLSGRTTHGYLAEETLDYLRANYGGWDFYTLHAEFEQWVAGSQDRTPANWQKAFIGWVRRHHEKNKHQLRGR